MDTLKTIPAAKGIDVYGRLRDFFNKYYTAQYMTLVVHSKREYLIDLVWLILNQILDLSKLQEFAD